MSFNQASTLVVLATLVVAWWLSRYDTGGTGVGRRVFRSLLTAALAELIFWCAWRYSHYGDVLSGLAPIPVLIFLAFLWAGTVSEIFSRGFGSMFDSDGRRAFDEHKGDEGLRQLNKLVQEGRQEEALKLSRKLRKSGDTNIIVLEAMLQHLGLDDQTDRGKLMTMARQLHAERRVTEAERVLVSLLEKHPNDAQAAVLLIRIYIQDTREAGKAAEVLRSLEKQPGVSSGMIKFAQSLIADQKPSESMVEPAPEPAPKVESVDDLITNKRYGTAIELLKARVKEQPADFEAWSKLAEVNGRHCGSLQQVENIIKLLEAEPHFTPDQIHTLRIRLEEWRTEWRVANLPPKASNPAPAPAKEVSQS